MRFQRSPVVPAVLAFFFYVNVLPAQNAPPHTVQDTSPHMVHMLTVETDVRLEVLDWGGTGQPILLIPGGGLDAHEYDHFAPDLTASHHVYAMTRRGYGASSSPKPDGKNYSSDRLGDDVVAIIDQLKLTQPVLIGHSLGGVELSSVGSRYPDRVAALVYLDAAYSYAFYSTRLGDPIMDVLDLHRRLTEVMTVGLGDATQLRSLRDSVKQLDTSLETLERQRALMPPQRTRPANAPPPPAIPMAIALERTRYTKVAVPVLAIFASPHNFGNLYQEDPAKKAAVIADDKAMTTAQAEAVRDAVPTARVILIPNGDHQIFESNKKQVMEELETFLSSLPSSR